jgi:hypothetical protein
MGQHEATINFPTAKRAKNQKIKGGRGRSRRTSKEMWSSPRRISSSCRPTTFFLGHDPSSSLELGKRGGRAQCFGRVRQRVPKAGTYLMTSDSCTIRLSSDMVIGLSHTVAGTRQGEKAEAETGARESDAGSLSLRINESFR